MSQKEDPIVILSKVVTKQQLIINSMSKMISDLVKITTSSLKKCDKDECNLPSTISFGEKYMCDRHAAIDIVSKSSSESDWKEVKNAEQIRFISDYTKVVESLESSTISH